MPPIPIPVTKTKIATVPWGIPITNEVNRLTPLVDGLADLVGRTFANYAALIAWAAPNGATAVTLDNHRVWERISGAWKLISGPVPRVLATKNSVQALAGATPTVITYPDAEHYDTDGMHSTSTNTSRLTIPANYGGMWQFFFNIYFVPVATAGSVQAWVAVNAGAVRYAFNGFSMVANDSGSAAGSAILPVNAGDYLEVTAYSTAARNTGAPGLELLFGAYYLGPT
jgi:hypothetical protein